MCVPLPLAQTYGIFFATSFLDMYHGPHSETSNSSSVTVTVDADEQYLFLVSLVFFSFSHLPTSVKLRAIELLKRIHVSFF